MADGGTQLSGSPPVCGQCVCVCHCPCSPSLTYLYSGQRRRGSRPSACSPLSSPHMGGHLWGCAWQIGPDPVWQEFKQWNSSTHNLNSPQRTSLCRGVGVGDGVHVCTHGVSMLVPCEVVNDLCLFIHSNICIFIEQITLKMYLSVLYNTCIITHQSFSSGR